MVSEALLTWAAAVKDPITPARARGITCSSTTSSIAHLPQEQWPSTLLFWLSLLERNLRSGVAQRLAASGP